MDVIPKQAVVGVIGAGAMGAGIAQVAASYGHPVKLYDMSSQAVSNALHNLAKGLDKQVARGKVSAQQAQATLARIIAVSDLAELSDAALVIEAIVEQLDVKRQLFSSLEAICRSDVVFASNTSSLSITALGAVLQRPERLAGMHFFNPPQAMKLVEVIAGLATDEMVLDSLMATAGAWGKQPVRTKSTPGFIVNRVARPFYAEALRMLQDGVADCRDIDAILCASAGFRMGPFSLMDLIGHDVNYAVTESVFQAYYQDPRFKPSVIQKELLNGGFLGRKSGRGFYHYDRDMPEPNYFRMVEPQTMATAVGKPYGLEIVQQYCARHGVSVMNGVRSDGAWLEVNSTRMAVTDGRTATELSRADQHDNWVLIDLIGDIDTCPTVALACSDLADAQALVDAAGFFQALGKEVIA